MHVGTYLDTEVFGDDVFSTVEVRAGSGCKAATGATDGNALAKDWVGTEEDVVGNTRNCRDSDVTATSMLEHQSANAS